MKELSTASCSEQQEQYRKIWSLQSEAYWYKQFKFVNIYDIKAFNGNSARFLGV